MDFDAIITGIRKAIYGREVREYIASSMEWTRDFVNQSITDIKELLRQAEAARDAAKASQDAAKVSEANAKVSENAAKTSETKAKTSETNAKASENAAKTSESNAKTSETNAKSSETKAATSAANAKASENEARQLVEAAMKVVNTDKTLTIDGAPADAKAVGDKFKSIKTDWNSVTDKPETFPPSAHTHSYAGSSSEGGDATRALGIKDYGGSQTIEIGWAPVSLTASEFAYIAAYTDSGRKIKTVSKDTLKSWLDLGSAAYEANTIVRDVGDGRALTFNYSAAAVNYDDFTWVPVWIDGQMKTVHKNVFSASGVQSSGSDYIRFGDGTQICWGSIGSKSFNVTGNVHYKSGSDGSGNDVYKDATKTASYSANAIIFPQPFVNGNYSLAFQVSYGVSDASVFNGKSYTWEETEYYPIINKPYTVTYTGNFTSISSTSPAMGRQATYCTFGNGAWGNYIAIGRWK